jgi:methionine transaminase
MGKLQTGTSIFTKMSKMAADHNAINLSQGFPNFPVDDRLTGIVGRVAKANVHQYMPSAGFGPLLERISHLVQSAYNRAPNPESEILVTAGATQAIFTTIQALVNAGEEVIILDPAYDCYDAPVILCGAKPVHVPLNSDFLPDWTAIADAITEKTGMIIINNPHNPSGKIWSEAEFVLLEALLELHPKLLVLSDEVYEFITFESRHISLNTCKTLLDRCIVVSSFGKSFHITGWKIGYVVAPEPLMAEIKKVHQFLVFSVNSVAQAAIAEYLDLVDLSSLGEFYKTKRDYFRQLLKGSRFTLLPCEGSYFQIASYAGISDESDIDFTKRLVTEIGVAAIPLSVFYESKKDDKLIRFCFAKTDATLEEAAKRLHF